MRLAIPFLAVPLLLPVNAVVAQPPPAQPPPTQPDLRVFVPPPLEWNRRTLTARRGTQQGPQDLARINAGLTFGMTPEQVAAVLPGAPTELTWNNLRTARDYPTEVRYFWLRLDDVPAWRSQIKNCAGKSSYAAFLFTIRGLFRVSFRLLPDAGCPSLTAAALDLFAPYVTLTPDVALSIRYRSGPAEVVDITDPTAAALIPVRWQMNPT